MKGSTSEVERYCPQVEELLWYLSNLRNAHAMRRLIVAKHAPVEDVVSALSQGADDVLLHSLSNREFQGRLTALLRSHPVVEKEEVLCVGGVRLIRKDLEMELDGERKKLSRTEFNLLAFLMEHAGQVLSRDVLLDTLWFDWTAREIHLRKIYDSIV